MLHPITIGIDGNEANVDKQVGVSVYTFEILQYFAQWANHERRFIVYLREPPRTSMPAETPYFRYFLVWGPRMWLKLFLPFKLWSQRQIDVFWSPAHYVPEFCPVPIVVTIHDLAYLHYPQEFLTKDLYQLTNWTVKALNQAKQIIAVSQSTAEDIVANYPHVKRKINVVYNGFKTSLKTNSVSEPDKYLLYVGTIQPRKNIITLIKAFELFSKTHPDFKLILVGKKGWLFEETFAAIKLSPVRDKIFYKNYVSDVELDRLYSCAWAYVLPSLYEGFGIPVLEAMAKKVPTVLARASSLPEVAGEAALYFNPQDAQDLCSQLVRLDDLKLRQQLIERGTTRVSQFSWEQSAKETLQILITSSN